MCRCRVGGVGGSHEYYRSLVRTSIQTFVLFDDKNQLNNSVLGVSFGTYSSDRREFRGKGPRGIAAGCSLLIVERVTS
jgi:hypothetical protein